MYFVRDDGKSTPAIVRLDLADLAERAIAPCYGGCGRLWLSSDGKSVFTTHKEYRHIFYVFGDVYSIDLDRGRERRITQGARARDVACGRSGAVYYASTDKGQAALVRLRDGTKELLVPFGVFKDLGDPAPSPDGNAVVFAGNLDGLWDLFMLDLNTRALRRLTKDTALDRDPTWGPSGRFVYFSSSRGNGVFNLFAVDTETWELYRLTNVLGGAFWPRVDPSDKQIAFVSYSSRGYDLALLRLDESKWKRVGGLRPVVVDVEKVGRSDEADRRSWHTEDYSGPWLARPRALRPTLSGDVSHLYLGVQASGSDPAGRHHVSASFASRVDDFRPQFDAGYSFDGFRPTLTMAFATYPKGALAIVDDRPVVLHGREYAAALGLAQPIPGRRHNFRLGARYILRLRTDMRAPSGKDPASRPPRVLTRPRGAAISFFLEYWWLERYFWSISTEKGLSVSVGASAYSPYLGGQGTASTAWFNIRGFLPLCFRGHLLAIRGSGGLSLGERPDRDYFSIGGVPSESVLSTLLTGGGVHAGGLYLRGFAPDSMVGSGYLLGSMEYRFPIWFVHRGLSTLPLAARRVWGTLFLDAGEAFFDRPDTSGLRMGMGAEVNLSLELFYSQPQVLKLGFSRGFGPGGSSRLYFRLGL